MKKIKNEDISKQEIINQGIVNREEYEQLEKFTRTVIKEERSLPTED